MKQALNYQSVDMYVFFKPLNGERLIVLCYTPYRQCFQKAERYALK